mgnify:FL=1
MKKKLDSYSETLFHLINFRCKQYRDSKSKLKMDYDSFIIISSIGAHYLKNNSSEGSDWDSVWEMTRPKKIEESYNKKKLTIFALSNIVGLPKETVRRKVEALKKRKLISHSTNIGLMPTEKIEELMKPFALSELKSLSKFLQALKKHKALDQLLSF